MTNDDLISIYTGSLSWKSAILRRIIQRINGLFVTASKGILLIRHRSIQQNFYVDSVSAYLNLQCNPYHE